MNIDGYILKKISGSNPESYEVYFNDKQVCYLAASVQYFCAYCPDLFGGESVYESEIQGVKMFTVDERMEQLTNAIEQIKLWLETNPNEKK